jgi:hypothetical protein
MVAVDQQRLAYQLPALVLQSTEALFPWPVEGLQIARLVRMREENRLGTLPKQQGLVLLERQLAI